MHHILNGNVSLEVLLCGHYWESSIILSPECTTYSMGTYHQKSSCVVIIGSHLSYCKSTIIWSTFGTPECTTYLMGTYHQKSSCVVTIGSHLAFSKSTIIWSTIVLAYSMYQCTIVLAYSVYYCTQCTIIPVSYLQMYYHHTTSPIMYYHTSVLSYQRTIILM